MTWFVQRHQLAFYAACVQRGFSNVTFRRDVTYSGDWEPEKEAPAGCAIGNQIFPPCASGICGVDVLGNCAA